MCVGGSASVAAILIPTVEQLGEGALAAAAPTLAARTAAVLGRDLAGAAPSVARVATELAMSSRSLHRRLAAEGTSYQRVLDSVRRDEAIRQALEERRSFKRIAAAVGFSDPRAFRRAFKRWTGTTPQQFRLRGIDSQPDETTEDEAHLR